MRRLDVVTCGLLALIVGLAVGRSSGPGAAPRGERPAPGPVESAAAPITLAEALRALDDPQSQWHALRWLGEQGEKALPALPRVVEVLRGKDIVAARLAAEALGRMGPAASIAEEVLRRTWDDSTDAHLDFAIETAMRQIGGWSCFPDEVPEEVTDLDRPYLKVVELAHRRTWLRGEEAELAKQAWKQTRQHLERLGSDRLYRLGELTRANLRHMGVFREYAFESLWSPPFLICVSDGTPVREGAFAEPPVPPSSLAKLAEAPSRFAGLLEPVAGVVQAVYRGMLATYGDELGMRALESPFGGRPDLKPGVRSFEDGFPIVIWIWSGRDVWYRVYESKRWSLPPGQRLSYAAGRLLEFAAERDEGGATHVDLETAALATAMLGLEGFVRQANKWSRADLPDDPVTLGLLLGWAGWRRDPQGALVRGEGPESVRSDMQDIANDLREMGKGPPDWVSLREYLAAERWSDADAALQQRSHPPLLRWSWHRYQAWGLVRWLEGSTDLQRRAALRAGLGALLRRERPGVGIRNSLGVRADDDWTALEADYRTWLDGHLRSAPR